MTTAEPASTPPAAAVLAAVGAIVGAVPAAFVALYGVVTVVLGVVGAVAVTSAGDTPAADLLASGLALAGQVQLGLLAAGAPVLLVLGAVHLLTGRDRLLLLVTCLPVTAYAVWQLGDGGGDWLLLVVAGPALAPLPALLPSVRRWLAPRVPDPG